MNYRRLGRSGLQVSELSFGSWVTFGAQIGDTTSTDLMKMAYDAGINFFDNAEIYANGKSELVMGEILKNMGWARDTYIISSKAFRNRFSSIDGETSIRPFLFNSKITTGLFCRISPSN